MFDREEGPPYSASQLSPFFSECRHHFLVWKHILKLIRHFRKFVWERSPTVIARSCNKYMVLQGGKKFDVDYRGGLQVNETSFEHLLGKKHY